MGQRSFNLLSSLSFLPFPPSFSSLTLSLSSFLVPPFTLFYTTQVLSPLAAVDDVASLQNGILASSSLSMTSRDSFLLWEEISRLFPAAAVEKLSPYNFFGVEERITLQVINNFIFYDMCDVMWCCTFTSFLSILCCDNVFTCFTPIFG